MGTSHEDGGLLGRPSKYSPEFREQAVEVVRATGKTIAEVARDLQIKDTTLSNWVKADRAERGEPDSSGLPPLTAVGVLCRLLKVSRSGFYAWLARPASARALADEVLTAQIGSAFDDNRKVYGASRIHAGFGEVACGSTGSAWRG